MQLNDTHSNEESDDYLLELMGLHKDFPDEAMVAYGHLYSRYWKPMFIIAKGVNKDEAAAQDLLADTFNMVFRRASTFKKGKLSKPEDIQFLILKWMTAIMKNVFYDNYLDDAYKKPASENELEESYLIEKKSIAIHFSEDFEDFCQQQEKEEGTESISDINYLKDADSANLSRVKIYLDKLSERDKDIILTTYNHYVPGKNTPTPILDMLEDKWSTTRDNIRQILSKFRKSIKSELEPQMIIRK